MPRPAHPLAAERHAAPGSTPDPTRRHWLALAWLPLASLALGACSSVAFGDPPRVDLAGLKSLPGEGLELRFLAKLRVQNPNSQILAFEGVSLELDLRGQRFASGVAPLTGQIPGFGEAVLEVPVSVSGFTIARQVLDLVRQAEAGGRVERVAYEMRGKLGGTGLGGTGFGTSGEIDLTGLAR
jgi:LEA14-like dessication related protein